MNCFTINSIVKILVDSDKHKMYINICIYIKCCYNGGHSGRSSVW